MNHSGFAIALAWPETFCKQPGSWYDPLMLLMGFSTHHYYRVGHAAVILIDTETGKNNYFDFGRYHAPFKHGRVRSVETDHDLQMKTTALISRNKKYILNFEDILSELQDNKASHGEGELLASYCPINFQSASDKAMQMQAASPIPYGPFNTRGSNCSRFVSTVIRAGKPDLRHRFRLKWFVPFTPTPVSNVNGLENKTLFPSKDNCNRFIPASYEDPGFLQSTLLPPAKNAAIPDDAQWLSGEGAGSWFVLRTQNDFLEVVRYSPEGVVECSGKYRNPENRDRMPDKSYQISYPSNCKVVSLKNSVSELKYERVAGMTQI